MPTPSIFPYFLKAKSGDLVLLGSPIDALVQDAVTVKAEGDLAVTYELVSPVIVVEVVGIEVSVCDD